MRAAKLTPGDTIRPANWSASIAGGTSAASVNALGVLSLTGDGTNQARADQAVVTKPGRRYRLGIAASGNSADVSIGTTSGGSEISTATYAAGYREIDFVATAATTYFRVARTLVGAVTVTNLSLRLVG